MTIVYKLLRTGLAAGALLLGSQHASAAPAAESCRMADKLPLALSRAQQHEREPGEFADANLMPASFQRTPLAGDAVEYSFLLKVGPGDFDQIRLRRVVRERALCYPAYLFLGYPHGPNDPCYVDVASNDETVFVTVHEYDPEVYEPDHRTRRRNR